MARGRIGTQELIPDIESALFFGHQTSHLAVGIVGVGNNAMSGLENEFRGYSLLRGNVYARQKHFIPLYDLSSDGAETDTDDERSVHLAIIENAATSTRFVGAMRLIIKSPEQSNLLPIEYHYPEAFPSRPAPIFSAEVSRLICRHENKQVQTKLKWLLFSAGISCGSSRGLGPAFGAIDERLSYLLSADGVPIRMIAKAKFVPSFNATKAPFRIDLERLNQKIEDDSPKLLKSMQVLNSEFVYSGVSSRECDGTKAATNRVAG
jgi:hypothetical protein